MFRLNRITRVLMEKASDGDNLGNAGAGAEFNPAPITQGVGVFDDMKAQAVAQQKSQEETGSTSVEAASDPVVDDKTEVKQVDPVTTKDPEIAAEGSSDPVVDDKTEVADTGYTYKGLAVEVSNTPEMTADFKERGLDIDAVNKELYSEEGITVDTRDKLYEAFGKTSVDMYLEGLESKNAAMFAEHETRTSKQESKIDSVIKESTGDNYDAVMKWANDNLDAKQYSAYADIINGTNDFQIGLALKDLTAQSGLQSTILDQPVVKLKVTDQLLSADVTTTKGESEGLTAAEYKAGFTNGEYRKDPDSWDARRQAGMNAGL